MSESFGAGRVQASLGAELISDSKCIFPPEIEEVH
jgi:hypothetical protein